MRREHMVQRGHPFCIVDEVDSILIDEARTPLIISGAPETAADTYRQFARVVPRLTPGRRLRGRREAAHRGRHRERRGQGRARPRHRQPLQRHQRRARQPLHPGAARRGALPQGRRVRGAERRGAHRRRVHRPHPRRASLLRGPPPGYRGQGEGADPRGEPDPRHDHAAELLPHVRRARRHDRHGQDRRRRVPHDLRPRRRADPHQRAHGPRTTRTTSSSRRPRRSSRPSSTISSSATRRASRCSSARSRWRSARCSRGSSTGTACSTTC